MEGSGIFIYSGELHVSQELVHPAPRGQNSIPKSINRNKQNKTKRLKGNKIEIEIVVGIESMQLV